MNVVYCITLTGSFAIGGVFLSLWTGEKHTFPYALKVATTITSPFTGVRCNFSHASGSLRKGFLDISNLDFKMSSKGSNLHLRIDHLSFDDNQFFSKWIKWKSSEDTLYFRSLKINGARGDLRLTEKFKRDETLRRNRIGFKEMKLEDVVLNVVDSSKIPRTLLICTY